MEMTEAQAIRLAQNDDPAGFAVLYTMHKHKVFAICLRMLHDPDQAEDLTQDTFLRLMKVIKQFRGQSAFATWLHRIAVNEVLQKLRLVAWKKQKITASLEELREDSFFDVESDDRTVATTVERVAIERAVEQLPAGYKQAFVLVDVMGYSHGEAGPIMGKSVGCSKSQIWKARKKLKKLISGAA